MPHHTQKSYPRTIGLTAVYGLIMAAIVLFTNTPRLVIFLFAALGGCIVGLLVPHFIRKDECGSDWNNYRKAVRARQLNRIMPHRRHRQLKT